MSLWRALQLTSVKGFRPVVFFVLLQQKPQTRRNQDREVCVTVGLSSEVCLVPTSSYGEYFLPVIRD